jgi:opacity protein-like surface antigen
MKKTLALVLMLALALGIAQAGDNAKPIVKAGSTALMFDLGGLANLSAGNYQGGLGAKYFISNGFAVRVGLGFSTSSTTTKNPTTPTPTTQLGESKYTSTSFSVAPGIQYNVAVSSAVVGYVGAQVSFTSSTQERTGNANSFGVGFTKDNSYNETSSVFGAAAFIGVEWFAWDNISLAGEYRFGFTSSTGKAESKNATTSVSSDAPSSTSIGLGSGNAAALTLAVYF